MNLNALYIFQYVKNQEISDWTSNDKICKVLAKNFFQISVHDACFQAIKGLNYLHVTHSISKFFFAFAVYQSFFNDFTQFIK